MRRDTGILWASFVLAGLFAGGIYQSLALRAPAYTVLRDVGWRDGTIYDLRVDSRCSTADLRKIIADLKRREPMKPHSTVYFYDSGSPGQLVGIYDCSAQCWQPLPAPAPTGHRID